mmetsp:Transcript_18200/g.63984  ORF Transcript_18200/g.63984 Transcript_18200/m.63984 type:complete len:297 (+) Transcript_18200:1803-2693(+)
MLQSICGKNTTAAVTEGKPLEGVRFALLEGIHHSGATLVAQLVAAAVQLAQPTGTLRSQTQGRHEAQREIAKTWMQMPQPEAPPSQRGGADRLAEGHDGVGPQGVEAHVELGECLALREQRLQARAAGADASDAERQHRARGAADVQRHGPKAGVAQRVLRQVQQPAAPVPSPAAAAAVAVGGGTATGVPGASPGAEAQAAAGGRGRGSRRLPQESSGDGFCASSCKPVATQVQMPQSVGKEWHRLSQLLCSKVRDQVAAQSQRPQLRAAHTDGAQQQNLLVGELLLVQIDAADFG